MKNKKNIIIITGIAATVAGLYLVLNYNTVATSASNLYNAASSLVQGKSLPSYSTSTTSIVNTKLTSAEIAGLVKMREEEKLAHDVYVALGATSGQKIFTNIASSEQTHTDAVKNLLVQYGIADPASSAFGVFTDAALQKLYNELVAQGKKSSLDALKIGALIEDLDIADLEELLAKTTNTDVIRVYNNLLSGSENHIRSFSRQITSNGSTYTPTYITKERYQEILNSTSTTGQGGKNKGNGNRVSSSKGKNRWN